MRSLRVRGLAVAAAGILALWTTATARADDFGSRFTLSVAPEYSFSTAGDDNAPPPPGYTGVGYTHDHPTADAMNVDYGLDFKIDKKTHLSFSHSNIAYQLGRILLPGNTALVTGQITDYTDTLALTYAVGGGLGLHATYFNHQRTDVTGLCLNQKYCNDPTTGAQINNPSSIDEHGFTFGGGYDFGPNTKIGKLFNVGADLKYVPRPSTPNDPATVALGNLGSYVGSQILVPYSITMKLPVTNSSTFIPFVNYTHLPVLYRDSAVPEDYRGIIFGFVKVINKYVNLDYTNLNLQSCRCITRVPPPDNLRLSLGQIKLDFHTPL